jgi:hypothetical protein
MMGDAPAFFCRRSATRSTLNLDFIEERIAMNRAQALLTVAVLAVAYYLGMFYGVGLAAQVPWPWLPYAGKPVATVNALQMMTYAITVAIVAAIIAAAIAWHFPRRAFVIGLLVAVPASIDLAVSTWQAGRDMPLGARTVTMVAVDLILLLLVPALLSAWFARRRRATM